MNPSAPVRYRYTRVHARLKLATPVQVQVGERSFLCDSEDVSIGGLQARYPQPPPAMTQLRLRFSLPDGSSVSTQGIVRYARADRFGVQFLSLSQGTQAALREYAKRAQGYTRRGNRIAKRFTVTLRSTLPGAEEELAETVVLSRNGGRLLCRRCFEMGDELRLYWPRQNRAARIRVAFQRLGGPSDLAELGFQFLDTDDFWRMESLATAAEFLYWGVRCKTPGCAANILLKYIGLYDSKPTKVLINAPDKFNMSCGNCGSFHAYTSQDLVTIRTSEEPGPDWRNLL
jgi:hypothetical protein